MTKMPLFMLDKLHFTIVASNMVFGWKIKVNKIHFHPLTDCIHIVDCNKHATNLVNTNQKNDLLPCGNIFEFFKIFHFILKQITSTILDGFIS
jgi:hypothetical protein